jgi:hypothetical protein
MQDNYPESDWNADFNFMFDCLSFYLRTIAYNAKIQPPMFNARARSYVEVMGQTFHEWANVYFSNISGNLDREICRSDCFEDFKMETKINSWTSQKFSNALRAFCRLYDYTLNPVELCNNNGRIIRKKDHKAIEMFYIQTKPELAPESLADSNADMSDESVQSKMPF